MIVFALAQSLLITLVSQPFNYDSFVVIKIVAQNVIVAEKLALEPKETHFRG